MHTDIVIAGSGVAGLYSAIKLPRDKKITIITKTKAEECDSYLAQGGICVKRDETDFDSFFEDTLKAGHYENDKESVTLMIENSRDVIDDLIEYGVDFNKVGSELAYTKEGAHSKPRILFHADITGEEITKKLIAYVKTLENVTLIEDTEMVDIIEDDGACLGLVARNKDQVFEITADYTIIATGGVGGLYQSSTNFPHLTADGLVIAKAHNIALKDVDYVQIHPTSLYSKQEGRAFLITESVRGEGGILLDKDMNRFTDELMPRDVVSKAIFAQMEKDGTEHVWLSFENIPNEMIMDHFPNIYKRCLEEGFDITKEPIPVVPAQHYYMGGIEVDHKSKTSMDRLYAIGETSCNGVHGKNRLASNSLLEALVFAKIAACHIADSYEALSSEEKARAQRGFCQREDGVWPVDNADFKTIIDNLVKGN